MTFFLFFCCKSVRVIKVNHNNFFVFNGCKAAGIYDAIEMGSAKLPQLDPFLKIDGIVIPTNDFNS